MCLFGLQKFSVTLRRLHSPLCVPIKYPEILVSTSEIVLPGFSKRTGPCPHASSAYSLVSWTETRKSELARNVRLSAINGVAPGAVRVTS